MNEQYNNIKEKEFDASDFKSLLDAVGQAALVSMTDVKGNIIFVNDKFVHISKYSREELIGQNHRILKSGKQPQEMFDALWKTVSNGEVWRGEIMNRAKDGAYYWVDSTIAPILGNGGKPARYIAVRFLISDKKEVEKTNKAVLNVLEDLKSEREKLKFQIKETEKFALAVENASDHIIITDAEGVTLYANKAAETLTGFAREDMIGRKAGDHLWGRQMPDEFYKKMWRVIKEDKKTFSGELTNRRKDGTLYQAATSITPILDTDGGVEFFVGIERDVTKEKEIDKQKTEFVSLASHQLKTPIGSIQWDLEMLLDGDYGSVSDKQKEILNEAYIMSKRMNDLVNALLNISRIELGVFIIEPKPTDFIKLCEEVIVEMEPRRLKKGHELIKDFDNNLPQISADDKLLRIVYQNFISNAIKYTPDKGKIKISIKIDGKNITFSVANNGEPIPQADQPKIFSKMFRASNAQEQDPDGNGLGLYVVKQIVENAGGKIWFTSKKGEDTVFVCSFPLSGMVAKLGTKKLS